MSEPSKPKPAVIRQDGPHRVSVSQGTQSALSGSGSLSNQRLPFGAVEARAEVALGDGRPAQGRAGVAPSLHRRDAASSVTVRLAEPTHSAPRPAPQEDERTAQERRRVADALEARLGALSKLNAETSHRVVTIEAQLAPPAPSPATPSAPQPARFTFRRSKP